VNAGAGWNLQPLQADLVANARVGLLVLLGAAACVLLIACVNQANLLLARGTSRRSELAVRSALGAGQRRIVSQLLTESLFLAVLGGAAGVGGAYLLTDVLVALAPQGTPRIEDVVVNGRVLAFAAAVTFLSGIAFGLLPALRASIGLADELKEGGRGSTRAGGVRARNVLVAAQVALALVLLVGSGLLIRTFDNLRRLDLGFEPQGVLAFRVTLPAARYEDRSALLSFFPLLEERLAAVPGVTSVGATSNLPLGGLNSDVSFTIEGRPVPPPDQLQAVWFRRVTPAFHETLRVPIVRGRGIRASDDAEAPRVVVINETLARRYFPGEDPIGRRLNLGDAEDPVWWEIVGVAKDVKHFSLRGEARNALYASFAQAPTRTMFFVMRSERDLGAVTSEARSVLAALDPDLAASGLDPMERYVSDALAAERFLTTLLTLFAVVATTLAVVGLYGVVSYNVSSRVRELGVRLALGATGGDVGVLVVRRSLQVVAVGVAAGLAAALLLARLMASLLFGVGAFDPLTLAGVTALLTAAAVVASALPARRAARVDPTKVLRES